jgi:hypothetical protein
MKESYVAKAINQKVGLEPKPARWTVICGWTFALLGGFIGIGIARHIAYAKDTSDPSGRTYAYDAASRSEGRLMLVLAILMTVAWWFILQLARQPAR